LRSRQIIPNAIVHGQLVLIKPIHFLAIWAIRWHSLGEEKVKPRRREMVISNGAEKGILRNILNLLGVLGMVRKREKPDQRVVRLSDFCLTLSADTTNRQDPAQSFG